MLRLVRSTQCSLRLYHKVKFFTQLGHNTVQSRRSNSYLITDQLSQFDQFLQSLQHDQPKPHDAHTNIASNNLHSSTSMKWIVNSGATDHLTPHQECLFDVRINDVPSRVIHLPNWDICKVTHIDTIHIGPKLHLKDVLLFPNFWYNLIDDYFRFN